MRRQISLKSNTYTEGMAVYVEGISGTHRLSRLLFYIAAFRDTRNRSITRGDLTISQAVFSSRGEKTNCEKSAEAILA